MLLVCASFVGCQSLKKIYYNGSKAVKIRSKAQGNTLQIHDLSSNLEVDSSGCYMFQKEINIFFLCFCQKCGSEAAVRDYFRINTLCLTTLLTSEYF